LAVLPFPFAELEYSGVDLVGRKQEIDYVEDFLRTRDRGILIISGPPGIGKTALMAHLSKVFAPRSLNHTVAKYFFRADDTSSSPAVCLHYLCSVLSQKHGLAQKPMHIPLEAAALHLARLLQQISGALQGRTQPLSDSIPRELILIDYVNEADAPDSVLKSMPRDLPRRVYGGVPIVGEKV